MKEEESDAVAVAVAMPSEEGERKTPRRRLVQSTLFPHRPRRGDEDRADRAGKGEEGVEGEGEEECCGSQKKRKRKAKAETKTKRTATPKKAPDNGNNALGSVAENINSVAATSRRSPPEQERQEEDASPSAFQTPKKPKRPYRRKTMVNYNSDTVKDVVQQSDRSPEAVFDLRLEAKLAAEENARMSTGKQTHPFFSLWKVGKNCQRDSATVEVGNNQCSVLPDSESNVLHPIHVFEMRQDDSVSLDWKNWKFRDDYSLASTSPENQCSSLFERLTEPLKLDTCPAISNYDGICFRPDASLLSHFPTQVENSGPVIAEISPVAGQHSQNLNDLKLHQIYHDCNLEHPQEGFLNGRTMPYYCCHGDQLESSLWTDKYQPKKASEVCGNNESVQFLNEWLGSWRERYSGVRKNSKCDSHTFIQDEYSLEEGDSDTESMDGASSRNVLLITGPVGSGKSASIYACASEQGFEVIEVSASDWRNGAHVKQKFGAGLESLGLNKWSRSLIGPVNSRRKDVVDFLETQQSNSSVQEVDNGEIELISELCKEDLELSHVNDIVKDNMNDCRGADKTLILFEDVDTVFEEDRGFISTIQQMAETTKWPMILTSNSKDPELPDKLNRLKLCFASPAPKELFSLLDMVCAAENTSVQPQLLELLIRCCQGDIRKSLLLLQFWCQGNWNNADKKLKSASGALQFDLDVGHGLLPNIFPEGFSSQLSEIVEKEISKVLCGVKENISLLEVVEDDESSDQETQDDFTMVIKRKKEAMLNMNCYNQDAIVFSTQFDSVADLSNSSGPPVAFTRRTARQRANTVLSSCSGDELIGNDSLVDLNIQPGAPSNGVLLDGSIDLHTYILPAEDCADISTDQLHQSDRIILQEELYNCSQEEKQHLHDTLRSIDVSCVPESSFVPETEIDNGVELPSKTVSCGHFPFTTDVSSRAQSFQSPAILDEKRDDNTIAMPFKILQTAFESTNNIVGESVHGDEEVGDSQNGHPTVLRSFQVMDECSRADFNRASTSGEDPWCLLRTHSVQNLWNKLRIHHEGLKLYATSEDRNAAEIVKVASGMTDLLSMADILYGCCSPLDSFDSTVAPCIEPNVSYCYDEQLKMTSIMVEHGFCYFAKESTARESHLGLKNKEDLEQGKLPHTTNTKVEVTVVAPERNVISQKCANSEKEWPRTDVTLEREIKVHLYDMVQTVVPSKLYLASKGAAFHEYLSSLGHISKLEASRVSEGINNTKRRRKTRAANHYLSTGPFTLSPEDVSFLARQTCYGKAQLATTNTSYR